ncbi:ligand-binding sensor domain-containing protein [Lacibacter luteus]|uniref:ligand-binding sensor domain-containing protein n=1 Tax=Lacibacter luteus TaxID=2508719 RepID=UPI0013E96683|nr:two-component regulator propeller domain-containing protein [Lacibacter luteus]
MNFHKLDLQNGLHDGTARCVGQDKFGFIWIGTIAALNRFDGKTVKQFTNLPGNPQSPYGSQPRCMHSDKKGRFWIGCETGLMEYDFKTAGFRKIEAFKSIFITSIASINDSILLVGTRKGLFRYNYNSNTAFNYAVSKNMADSALQNNAINDVYFSNSRLLLGTNKGLVIMDALTGKSNLVSIPAMANMPVISVRPDHAGNIWMTTYSEIKLVKLSADLKKLTIYDQYSTAQLNTQPLNVIAVMVDNKDRVWVITAIDGLMQYQPSTDSFVKHLYNSNFPSGPSGNTYRSIFQDNTGIIWLGCDVTGVNYFEPDQNLFTAVFPFPDRLDERARRTGRAVAEDKDGNLWMGNHDGVTKYNIKTKNYSVWRNDENKTPVIGNNVVRSMLCDDENNIWIGTASGVNYYDHATGKMEMVDEKKLPGSFYNSINKDRSGNIWFCTNDSASLYWYSLAEKKFYNISVHPQLKKYKGFSPTSYVLEDSKNRLWISFSRKGVVMLNKRTGQTKHYVASDTMNKGLIGNQVVDIKEDKDGVIWVTSFNGITGIDVERNRFISFNNKNGLAGNMTAPLVVDSLNRVWVGVNGGMAMLHPDRKRLTNFTINDGLPSIGFPEHAGITAANGDIILPSYNGFIRFDPLAYKEETQSLLFYISGYSIFDKSYNSIKEGDEDPVLKLKPHENSFTFNLVALNYRSPSQTWFAYKLDGFEKEWHYTQDPKAVYTNVPGAEYTFLYKAMVGNGNWDKVVAKTVSIKLATVFYKTNLFRIALLLLIASFFYALYKYRTKQQRQLYQLKSKAQLLEKEKTMVMYESLKQQLNPHFLFNSLTSLSGLIETNQQVAGDFLEQMSGIYRYILKNGDTETVFLKDEIEFVQLYINMQQTRFKKGLQINMNVPDEYFHYKIAPVTLQNLIENAIKHNVIDVTTPLVINIFIEDDYVVVKNNLQLKHVVETSNKKGLAQFTTLYRYLSNLPVVIEETDNYFLIKVPLI